MTRGGCLLITPKNVAISKTPISRLPAGKQFRVLKEGIDDEMTLPIGASVDWGNISVDTNSSSKALPANASVVKVHYRDDGSSPNAHIRFGSASDAADTGDFMVLADSGETFTFKAPGQHSYIHVRSGAGTGTLFILVDDSGGGTT